MEENLNSVKHVKHVKHEKHENGEKRENYATQNLYFLKYLIAFALQIEVLKENI
ncbi:hypothetical protein ES708_27811 [subsurface metagenome]